MKRCPYCAEEIQDAAIKCKHCGAMLNGARPSGAGVPKQPLVRSRTDKVFSGVCAGLATYMGMDVALVRVIMAILILSTGLIPGLILYVIAAFIIPEGDD